MAGGEDVLVVAPGGGRDALLLVAQESAWRNTDGAGDGDDDDYGMLNFRPGLDGGDDDGFPYETITMWLVVVFLAMCLYGLSKLVLPYVPASWIIHRGFLIDRYPAHAHYCCFEFFRMGKLY
ncbi:hypothetical protein OsI_39204 [Oryza sativa Indica Group]|uniref:Uncharacterized protein n=3 Tax=Oryza TaxID=4527 RepID=A2ZMZ5_ORYSI|nr:hypothetical protein OsI_39204 [Oryza sativa Indica Group]